MPGSVLDRLGLSESWPEMRRRKDLEGSGTAGAQEEEEEVCEYDEELGEGVRCVHPKEQERQGIGLNDGWTDK